MSREHHEGLLLVWKIRQGIKNKVDGERIARYLAWFWEHYFQKHFREEEESLPKILSREHPLIEQMFQEHVQIKNTIMAVQTDHPYTKLEELAQTLNDHIRFEERILFNEVERVATEEQLQQLAGELKDELQVAVWEDEFWLRARQ